MASVVPQVLRSTAFNARDLAFYPRGATLSHLMVATPLFALTNRN